jgi:hypothetical protein
MKAPREAGNGWEKALSRYFAAHALPLQWDYPSRRFQGVAGHSFPRLNPSLEENVWARMPEYIRKYEQPDKNKESKQVVVLATNRKYGDSIDDTLVVMRLGTFIPMLKAMIQQDRERWIDNGTSNH